MEESKIYDILDNSLLNKWKESIEHEAKDSPHFADVQEAFEELEKQLNEQGMKLLKLYSVAFENKLDYIFYNLKIKILNFGIKVGMELEKAFAEFEE